jgi:hypothetical protein
MLALGLMLMAAAAISGCSSQSEVAEVPINPNSVVVKEPEPMSLAFASVSNSRAMTRLTDEIVQNNTTYRDIPSVNFHFIALKKNESGVITSVSNAEVDKEETSGIKTNAFTDANFRYYHFNYCNMPLGVNGCMVYAKAQDEAKATDMEKNTYNGSLRAVIPGYVYSTSQIYFEPVSIYDDATVGTDGIHADAWALANALTAIAEVKSSNDISWSTFDNPKLKPLYTHFVNYGYDLPGSAASVRKWIEAVKVAAEEFSFGDGTTDKSIRDNIISQAKASLTTIAGLDYPQNINLPDGAAVVRWADTAEGKKFVPQLQTTTLDDINSVSRFAYPPALYYFVNSDIQTSNSKVLFPHEDGGYEDDASWGAVLTRFHDGTVVSSSTKTVAIKEALQYAVAQLSLKVQVDAEKDATKLVYDNDGNTIIYNDGNNYYFRLTGVIIGGQRKVGYDFRPINNSDADVKFVYDSQVKSDFVLQQNSTDEFNTLVLQSYGGEDVNIILEFEYTGDTAFKCLNGYVYPNTRFYLVGEVKLSGGSGGDASSAGRVFTQDYTTTIQMTVKSLEKAYNVLPSILAKNLEIGVQTTPQWKAAIPSDPVIME